ncbi:MAG: hypothetical protein J7M34_05375, partial [Anaerolineae bacterium]|nr:hypothetical protein [Anaerolineae bacterium]
MNVRQVVEIAKEWVQDHGSQLPGFHGAHLMGTINYLPKDAPFPPYKDVDMNLVLEDHGVPLDAFYKGLILEGGRVSVEEYRSPEAVLSHPGLAPNLAVNSILSDPSGLLTRLHTVVAQEYPRRKWVLARCEAEKKRYFEGLQKIRHADSVSEALVNLYLVTEGLTGIVAVAALRPPTHRRCLILMRQVLEEHGMVELEEDMLRLMGF